MKHTRESLLLRSQTVVELQNHLLILGSHQMIPMVTEVKGHSLPEGNAYSLLEDQEYNQPGVAENMEVSEN
jgi:hypothetical protein